MLGVLLVAFYLGRSELILGPFLKKRVTQFAKQNNIEIEVSDMEPAGFFSIALKNVSLKVPKNGLTFDVFAETIVLTPTWSDGLKLGDVLIKDAHLSAAPTKKKATPKPKKKSDILTPKVTAKKRKTVVATKRQIRFENVKLTHKKLKRDFEILTLDLDLEGRKITGFKGFARTPDNIDSILSYNGSAFKLLPEKATQLDEWVAFPANAKVSLTQFSFCPSCERKGRFYDLDIEYKSQKLNIDHVDLIRSGKDFELIFGEVVYGDFPARIVDWRLIFNLDDRKSEGRITISELTGGKIEARWNYDEQLNLKLLATDFSLQAWDAINPLGKYAHANAVSGSLDIKFHPVLNHVDLRSTLKLNEVTIRVGRIARDPVTFPTMRLLGNVLIDLDGRAVSFDNARVELEASDPVFFEGNIVDAKNGLAFNGSMNAPRLNAVVIRDALPKSMTKVINDANIDGDFGFQLAIGGHTAFPEKLFLDGDIFGKVNVLKDGSQGDIDRIRSGPIDGYKKWVALSSVPEFVAYTITAAEDVSFFNHPGFDWTGIKRAMIHNIKVGRLERGASTISQQVSKNVFLSGKRTASRKLQEMYLTWRLESELSKIRILEIYLNIASWGVGITGISAASNHYFSAPLAELSVVEVALLGAILPSPARFGGHIKKQKIAAGRAEKIEHILNNLRFLNRISTEEYRRFWGDVKRGKVGRLQLDICDDGAPLEMLKGSYKKC